jgi:hypothetical protein
MTPLRDSLSVVLLAADMLAYWKLASEHFRIPDASEFTCFDCSVRDTCEYAWGLYNTNGDCIAELIKEIV